jgi:predicted nucleic acid-binding protein
LGDLIVADTDAVIDFFSGRAPLSSAVRALIESGRLAVTAVTVFELYAGITGPKRLQELEKFLDRIPVLPLSAAEGEITGRLFTRLKSRGITIGNQDLLIAATVLALGLTLLTRNVDHFGAIEGLKIAPVAARIG